MPQPVGYVSALTRPVICIALVLLLASVLSAFADEVSQASDRIAIDTCLRQEMASPERCIGIAYKACIDVPGGSTTAGMAECAWRETRVWDEKIETALKQLLAGSLGKTVAQPWNRPPENRRDKPVPGTGILMDMQRTWLAWRVKKCDVLSLQAEGGSLSRVLYGSCFYEETGRHALWLNALVNDTK